MRRGDREALQCWINIWYDECMLKIMKTKNVESRHQTFKIIKMYLTVAIWCLMSRNAEETIGLSRHVKNLTLCDSGLSIERP
jgi:hypothetical protein